MERKDWMKEAFGPSVRKTPSMMPFVIIALVIAGAGLQGLLDRHKKIEARTNTSKKNQTTTSSNRQDIYKREAHEGERVVEMSTTREPSKHGTFTVATPSQSSLNLPNRNLTTIERVFYENQDLESPTRQRASSSPATTTAWDKDKALAAEKMRAEKELQRKIAQEESRKAALAREKAIAESRERAEQELLRRLAQEGPKPIIEEEKIRYLQHNRLATEINTRGGEKPSSSSVYKIGPKRKLGKSGNRVYKVYKP